MGLCAHPGVSYCSIDVVKELLHRLVKQSGRVNRQLPQDKDLKLGKRRGEERMGRKSRIVEEEKEGGRSRGGEGRRETYNTRETAVLDITPAHTSQKQK